MISAQATDPPERLAVPPLEAGAAASSPTDFKDQHHALRIVVVKDMWLTGFDAPVLHTLYIDKPMRDHGLLQAIARVNRVFRDKPGGLVVDYIGIGEDLRASLRAYDDTDLDDPVIPAREGGRRLREKYEVLCALLYPAGYRAGRAASRRRAAALFLDAYNYLLGDDEQRSTSSSTRRRRSRAGMRLRARSRQRSSCASEIGFFNRLAAEVRKITAPDAQASPAAEQAVRQFMSEGLAAGEIVDVLAVADQDRPEISVLSDEFLDSIAAKTEHPNIQIRLLEKLLKGEIRGARAHQPGAGEALQRADRGGAAPLRAAPALKRRGRRAARRDRQEPARRPPPTRAARARPSRRPRSTTRSPAATADGTATRSSPRSPASWSRASAPT